MNPAQRRRAIGGLLGQRPLTKSDLLARLNPPPTQRTLDEDLRWLAETFPSQMQTGLDGRAKTWRFIGEIPHLLSEPLTHLDDDQVAALIVARGLLRLTDPDKTATEGTAEAYPGTLAQALDRLLRQTGQAAEADRIAPDAVTISRFGVAPEEHLVFPLCFQAIRAGEALRFTYTNQSGKVAPVHAQPIRLAHISGEWYCFAWAADATVKPGKIKQYRLSRMTTPTRTPSAPPGCPHSGLRAEVTALLKDAFRATGSTTPADRVKVVLAISPAAWSLVEQRRWGANLKNDLDTAGLPPGWRRLSFVTTGLRECRHWVLSFGTEVRAEHPPALVEWIRDQARQVFESSPQTGLRTSLLEETPP